MQFKVPALSKEFKNAPILLKLILLDADRYCMERFGKELTVTRILEPVSGESGVHQDYRAADCRDVFKGEPRFTENEITELLAYVNKRYARNDGKDTVIHHSFQSGPKHFHFQVAALTKAYMPTEKG